MSAPIAYFYPEGHSAHSQPNHPERPQRVETIRLALEEAGLWQLGAEVPAESLAADVLAAVHSADMLQTIQQHAAEQRNLDADTFTTRHSWPLAQNAAAGAVAVARAVWRGEAQTGFALSRPPGHHATRTQPMGFCLLNNVALAAQHLLQREGAARLAILDMDVHHGNGTQDIFYDRADVLFCNTQQLPLWPGTGRLEERGTGAGLGFTANLPLPPGSGDAAFDAAYGELFPALLDSFKPEMLLVSFGFDSHWKDPLANLQVSAAGYGRAVASLRNWAQENCEGKIALILEGGYDLEAAAACGQVAAQALLGQPITDGIGLSTDAEGEEWKPVFDKARNLFLATQER
ncbi:MAG: histone deacetylase [Anaerolineales bacterium]|nr:MAG: histone deacetylase [Anaerolineales bacterium]